MDHDQLISLIQTIVVLGLIGGALALGYSVAKNIYKPKGLEDGCKIRIVIYGQGGMILDSFDADHYTTTQTQGMVSSWTGPNGMRSIEPTEEETFVVRASWKCPSGIPSGATVEELG